MRLNVINILRYIFLKIKSITIDGYECQSGDFKILQCREFLIDVGESIEINFEINTKFNNFITNKVVKFHSEYHVFELNVIIIISKDLSHFWSFSKILFFIIIPSLITFLIFQKLFISDNKLENSKITGGHIESVNKFATMKELENKNNEGKKKE